MRRECQHLSLHESQQEPETMILEVLNLSHYLEDYCVDYSDVICNNCWISIIPHIDKILQFIKNYQSDHLRTKSQRKQYIESLTGYGQCLFMHYLLLQSFTIQYIMKHKKLYECMFDISMQMFHILHIENEFGVVIPKQNESENEDNYCVMDDLYEWQQGTWESREILRLFDETFIATSSYWKRKHFKYLNKKWNFINFIKHDLIRNLLQRCKSIQFDNNLSWKIYIEDKVTFIVDWFLIYNGYKFIDFKQYENQICIRKLIYVYWSETLQTIPNRNAKDKRMFERGMINGKTPLTYIMNMLFKENDLMRRILWQNIEKLINNNERQRDQKLYMEHKSEYFIECCSPKCDNLKLDIDMEKAVKEHGTQYISMKFYRCKRCKVAVYCSRRCQKTHWNTFKHKQQCHLFV
eukprot:245871_1